MRSKLKRMNISMTSRTPHRPGFTIVELMIVVAIIGILAAIAVPYFVRTRTTAQKSACISNLREIENAMSQWALDQKQSDTAPVNFADISPYLKDSVICPAGGTSFTDSYSITTASAEPACTRVPMTHWLTGPTTDFTASPAPPAGPSSGSGSGSGGSGGSGGAGNGGGGGGGGGNG